MKFTQQIFNKLLCLHEWEIWKEIGVQDIGWGTYWTIFHLKCKKCGKLKKIKSH